MKTIINVENRPGYVSAISEITDTLFDGPKKMSITKIASKNKIGNGLGTYMKALGYIKIEDGLTMWNEDKVEDIEVIVNNVIAERRRSLKEYYASKKKINKNRVSVAPQKIAGDTSADDYARGIIRVLGTMMPDRGYEQCDRFKIPRKTVGIMKSLNLYSQVAARPTAVVKLNGKTYERDSSQFLLNLVSAVKTELGKLKIAERKTKDLLKSQPAPKPIFTDEPLPTDDTATKYAKVMKIILKTPDESMTSICAKFGVATRMTKLVKKLQLTNRRGLDKVIVNEQTYDVNSLKFLNDLISIIRKELTVIYVPVNQKVEPPKKVEPVNQKPDKVKLKTTVVNRMVGSTIVVDDRTKKLELAKKFIEAGDLDYASKLMDSL